MGEQEFQRRIGVLEGDYKEIRDKSEAIMISLATNNTLINGLIESVKELKDKDIKEIKNSVDSITRKPADNWRLVVTAAITSSVGAFVGYIVSIMRSSLAANIFSHIFK